MGLTRLIRFAPQAKRAAAEGVGGIVHFEIMPKNINKVVQATEAVEGDVATNLALLLPHVKETSSRPEWFSQINDWKERLPFAYEKESPNGLIKPQSVIEKLSDLTADIKHNTIITTGVGQHQMWTAQVNQSYNACISCASINFPSVSAFPMAVP